MSHDPNLPPQQPEQQPGQDQPPNPGQPFPPQFHHPQQGHFPGQFQQQHTGQPYPQGPYQQQPQAPQPQQERLQRDPNQPKGRFGVWFWIVGGLLAIVVLANAVGGHGESILIFLGLAAGLTGLYTLIFKKPSWASLPNRNAAIAVAIAGGASLLIGSVAAGADARRDNRAAPPETATSATLEADAQARLKEREDALAKAEAESTARLEMREAEVKKAEEAVKAREAAVGGAEAAAAANTIKEGTWTVGRDISPGTYRTTAEVGSRCYWSITVTGSNGADIIENDIVSGGFPQVVLSEGQTFESSRCGTWTKQ